MRGALLPAAACVSILLAPVAAQTPASATFPPEQIKQGAETFAIFCEPCHGERMSNPELFDLKKFPPDGRSRFINSVTNGKNAMPPWRGQIKPDDIEALWAYVSAGEKNP